MTNEDIFFEFFKDLGFARTHARMFYDVTIENLLDSGSSIQGSPDKFRSRDQQRARLQNVSKALNQLSDDQYSDLNDKINAKGGKVPDFKGLLDAIDELIIDLKGKPGRSDLKPFHAAAPYLLQYLEANGHHVTSTIHTNSNETTFSDAIEFLNKEFQTLANDKIDRKSAAKTVIETWKKRQSKVRQKKLR
jgi:hypothetical protein